ncbi:MAG: hypothetical protein HYR60_10800 [Acidobacteria bacterium]|nr:hypothetical protein [Acidobacteriota bacterium]
MGPISRSKSVAIQTTAKPASQATIKNDWQRIKKLKTATAGAKSATAKQGMEKAVAHLFETRPAKKLSLEKLTRFQGGKVNQMHARFVVDTKNKIAWVPSWVKELRVPGKM